jgi:hypothetical protein
MLAASIKVRGRWHVDPEACGPSRNFRQTGLGVAQGGIRFRGLGSDFSGRSFRRTRTSIRRLDTRRLFEHLRPGHAMDVAVGNGTPRQMMLGMEILHLLGNGIFLTALACLYACVPSKWVRWAIYIETFHLYEHISLTATAYFIGKPIGMSTLFGAAYLGPREFTVGCRVSWHFAMNLLPMPFAMIGLMQHFRADQHGVDFLAGSRASVIAP